MDRHKDSTKPSEVEKSVDITSPTSEEEKRPQGYPRKAQATSNASIGLKQTHAQKLASDKQQYAYRLIKFCLWILVGFVAGGLVLPGLAKILFGETINNEILMVGMEMLKMILPLFIGYLFGRNGN